VFYFHGYCFLVKFKNKKNNSFKQLIFKFFGNSCLEVDVFYKKGIRHTPREWFIVPLEAVDNSIEISNISLTPKDLIDTHHIMTLIMKE